MNRVVNIVVIDGNVLYRRRVVSAIKEYPELRVLGDVSDSDQAMSYSWEAGPDVIIIGVSYNGGDGLESVPTLRKKFPNAKVIVMTWSYREAEFLKAMRAGVRGYLMKTAELTEVIESVRLVTKSDIIVAPSKATGLFERSSRSTITSRDMGSRLSLLEIQILKSVAQGSSNKRIASDFFVTESTIEALISNIVDKLNVRNWAEAVVLATSQGLLE